MPWKKATKEAEKFDRCEKIERGMSGYLAILFSLKKNNTDISAPATIKQMTFCEPHGKTSPPKLRPRRSISVRPTMEILPNQSIALIPSNAFVRGL